MPPSHVLADSKCFAVAFKAFYESPSGLCWQNPTWGLMPADQRSPFERLQNTRWIYAGFDPMRKLIPSEPTKFFRTASDYIAQCQNQRRVRISVHSKTLNLTICN
jgi:hypothetical protein